MPWNQLLIAACLITSLLNAADKPAYPAPAPAAHPEELGVNIQRTMTLLATSTPEHRNTVRILFYGQSITEQEWSRAVADDLRRRFPNADLVIENRAIGGFAAQILVNTAEHDLYPFYPDLLIFHVYGANQQYEEIIANTRKRTTAEVVMQLDHVTKIPPEKIDEKQDKGMWWDDLMNHKLLPDIAKKYGCGLDDVRSGWLDYLKANALEPKALLKDGVHLNEHGNFLMAELVKRYLIHRPELPDTVWKDLVQTVPVGRDLAWKDGKLALEFDGNRIDALAAAGVSGKAQVLIDGKKPSEFPECYAFTRPSVTQAGFWPAIIRVGHQQPLLLEDWTVRITEADDAAEKFTFTVTGSKTGADGGGSGDQKFVSTSGRVVIEPQHWYLKTARQFAGKKVPAGFEIHWKIVPLFNDSYAPAAVTDATRETVVTLAQGLPNGKHRLELIAEGGASAPVAALRVYRPPVK